MNSERELFEEWASSETGWDLYWSDHINQYMDHQTNGAWLSWQASAQRQGYKLVPVELNEKIKDAMCGYECNTDVQIIGCYKAMIGEVDE